MFHIRTTYTTYFLNSSTNSIIRKIKVITKVTSFIKVLVRLSIRFSSSMIGKFRYSKLTLPYKLIHSTQLEIRYLLLDF